MRPNYRSPPKPIERPDNISVLIPTRARPEGLKHVFQNFHDTVEQKNLFDVWLYVDDDDQVTLNYINSADWKRYGFPIHWHIAENAGSMGNMLNQLWQCCTTNPGIYFPFTDDYTIRTNHWDSLLREAFSRYDDGLMLGFPPDPTAYASQVLMPIPSAQWLNLLGYFLTNRFYFWFDDAWIDEIAQMVDRKVMIPFQLDTPGGRGKTPRMRNLPFWVRYFNQMLEHRFNDAVSILRVVHGNDTAALAVAIDKARRVAAALAHSYNKFQMAMFVDGEVNYRDTTVLIDEGKVAKYLSTELGAIDDLMVQLQRSCDQNAYAEIVELADVISLSTFKVPDVNYLKAVALRNLGFPEDALTAVKSCLAGGCTEASAIALHDELTTKSMSGSNSFYTFRSELRMPPWVGLNDIGFVLFPEEIPRELYFSIQRIIYENDIETVVDIGADRGTGSTHAVVSVLNKNPPRLIFCIEPDAHNCQILKDRFGERVIVYHGSSVEIEEYMSEDEVSRFYQNISTISNYIPLETLLHWRRTELSAFSANTASAACVKRIKEKYGISVFDLAILDGSLFAGEADLRAVYGSRFIVLSQIRSIKNFSNLLKLVGDQSYKVIESNIRTGCGYAVFKWHEQEVDNSANRVPPETEETVSDKQALSQTIEIAFGYMSAGNLSGASAICDSLLLDKVENFYLFYLAGFVACQKGNWVQAKSYFQRALDRSDGMPVERINEVKTWLAETERN